MFKVRVVSGCRWLYLALTSTALLGLAGCGNNYPVEGQVVWADGKPATELVGYSVIFDSEETHTSAEGDITAEGTFRLIPSPKQDGVPPGKYRVLIALPAYEGPSDRPRPAFKAIIDPRFHSFEGSKLEVTVESKKNQFAITVERAKS